MLLGIIWPFSGPKGEITYHQTSKWKVLQVFPNIFFKITQSVKRNLDIFLLWNRSLLEQKELIKGVNDISDLPLSFTKVATQLTREMNPFRLLLKLWVQLGPYKLKVLRKHLYKMKWKLIHIGHLFSID